MFNDKDRRILHVVLGIVLVAVLALVLITGNGPAFAGNGNNNGQGGNNNGHGGGGNNNGGGGNNNGQGGNNNGGGNGGGEGHTPVTICHATGSSSNPYVEITVDDDSTTFKGHLTHAGDIIPAPAEGCPGGTLPTATPIVTGTPFGGGHGSGSFGTAEYCGDFEGPTVELPNVGVPYHYILDGVTYSVQAFLGTAAEVDLTVNMAPGLCFDLKVKDPELGRIYTYRVAATIGDTVWIWVWEDSLDLVK
ncbi:MAG: hypothetical protein HYV90_06070 [Candidatus Woesebacteria bacterium]|nr:MAG: hypothetical protein HYV90_06070 [Candidatus Woesebacteria bacterium]